MADGVCMCDIEEGATKKKKKGSAYQTISAVHRVSEISLLIRPPVR